MSRECVCASLAVDPDTLCVWLDDWFPVVPECVWLADWFPLVAVCPCAANCATVSATVFAPPVLPWVS